MIGLVLCLISSPAAAQPADTPWPMFHHDLNHTGLSTHYGPDAPIVKWIFPSGDKIYGSPRNCIHRNTRPPFQHNRLQTICDLSERNREMAVESWSLHRFHTRGSTGRHTVRRMLG
jgi:hypothetical protein